MEELIIFEFINPDVQDENYQHDKSEHYKYLETVTTYTELKLNVLSYGRYYIYYFHIIPWNGDINFVMAKSTDSKKIVMIGKGHSDFTQVRRIQTINEIIN